jgi:hypothetical protein
MWLVGGTYITQILQNVVEILCLLVIVAQFLNGIPCDKVLGDFGPHVTLLLLSGRRVAFTVIEDLDADFCVSFTFPFPGCWWFRDNNPLTWSSAGGGCTIGKELCPSDARVLGPCHFSGTATCTVHADPLCAGWNVDDFPVSGGTMKSLAGTPACIDAGCDVVAFLVVVGGWRRNGRGGVGSSTIAGVMVMVVDVDFKVPSFGAHQNLVVVVVLWWWTATLNGWRATATAGT